MAAYAYRDLPITICLTNLLGLAILNKLNTEMRIYRTEFGTVMFILI